MPSPSRIAASVALCALPLAGQQALDRSRCFPITGPVRDAGTVDVTTGRWTRGATTTKASAQLIYDNTCTWTTQAYYGGFDWCEEFYDEGRIPSPSDPNAPAGAQASYPITAIEVSYCTFAGPLQAAGGYDMDLAFFDKLQGDCLGNVAPTPPPVSATATAWLPLAGLGLPGSTTVGFQACWVVNLDVSNSGLVLAGDGDGAFDGVGADDKFIWMQRQNTSVGPLWMPWLPDGFFISGEPATGGYGACTYDIPCGIDAYWGNTCGTGLDTFDAFWLNIDAAPVGVSSSVPGCAPGFGVYNFGTNCYAFGSYPADPLSSFHLRLRGGAPGDCAAAYCAQTKAASVAGCTAILDVTDCSRATGTWSATDIPRAAGLGIGDVLGVYLYTHGSGIGVSTVATSVPFGTLCLSGFKRSSPACSPALLAGAQPGVCNVGPMSTAVDCNGGALGIAVGEDVNVQLWYRDPGAAGNANFSNAVFYTVQ